MSVKKKRKKTKKIKAKKMNHKKIMALAVIVVILAIFVILLIRHTNEKFASPIVSPEEASQEAVAFKPFDENFSPSGKIYLSLSPIAKGNAQELGIYVYDLKTRKLEKFLDETDQGINYFVSRFSPQGDKLAFSAYLSESSKKDSALFKKNAQIYLADKDGKNAKLLAADSGSGSSLPVWSNDQKLVVFQSAVDINSEEKFIVPENWQIKVADLTGKETVITNGAYPKFLPDGKLLVLKSEGLYLFKTDGQDKGQLVWPVREGVKANLSMKFTVSKDGKNIAWLDPESKKIYMGEISAWQPLTFSKFKFLDGYAYGAMFSADGKYLAWEELEANGEKAKLNIYNTETEEQRTVVDLKEYYVSSFHLNDWTE